MAKSVRVKIPANAEELLKLAQLIFEQHASLGTNSPLNVLDWANQDAKIAKAIKLHLEAEELRRKADLKYKERDALVAPIDDLVKQSRDLLKALYRKEPKKLGEFGFEVVDTVRTKKTGSKSTE